jgi:micrococcal nuclease
MIISFVCSIVLPFLPFASDNGHQTFSTEKTYRVIRVIDGDTLVLATLGRVRLIGVDTPETKERRKPVEYFGQESADFLHQLTSGKDVRVDYDFRRKDRYGRVLAYLYLKDGTFVNEEIIRQGYGFAYTKFPFRFMEEFIRLEAEAREKNLGLWGRRRN